MEEVVEAKYEAITGLGQVQAEASGGDRWDPPVEEVFEVHVAEFGQVTFTTGTEVQEKFKFGFVVDAGEHKGKTFSKNLNKTTGEKSTLRALFLATLGEVPTDRDPYRAVGKPLRVLFFNDSYNGHDFKNVKYMSPAKGQTVPQGDVVLDDLDDEARVNLDEVFGVK